MKNIAKGALLTAVVLTAQLGRNSRHNIVIIYLNKIV